MAREWWEGDQAATKGYGTFEARQPPPEKTLLEELITDDEQPDNTFGGGNDSIGQQNQSHYESRMKQLQMDLSNVQLQMSREQPGSIRYNSKMDQMRNIQTQMQQLQIQMGS